jgi:mannose-6-phosphate isomerase-like protein (cupin superfamily)
MAKLHSANLGTPEETRTFENGTFEIVHVGDVSVGRATFQPGWRWSTSVKPIVGTDSCQQHHVGYVVSGRLKVQADDGTEAEVGPGDAYVVMPGHDAWVVGDETYVALEFQSAETYAKK